VKRPVVLLACAALAAVAFAGYALAGGGLSLSIGATGSYQTVSGSTVYYDPSGSHTGTFTVTATLSAATDTVVYPTVFATTDSATVTATTTTVSHAYTWPAGASASGTKTVTDTTSSDTGTFVVTPDTAPVVANAAPTEVTGAGDQFWSSSGNTLWYRPAGAGSFTLNATVSGSKSPITQVVFPDVSATSGWSGSTGGTDPESPYASQVTYAWTAGATAPGAKQVTATNGTGMTGTATVNINADATPPTGQSIAPSGGPWYSTASVPLTITAGTDAGAGVDASRGVVERASATLTNGVCGTFGSFAALTLSGGADTGVLGGNCYEYDYKATDNVGNVSTASTPSAAAKVDTTAPTVPTLLFSGLENAAASGNVVYYGLSGSGFTVTAAAADAESGIASYSFPTLSGFTAVGTGPSRTYRVTNTSLVQSGPFTVTATNAAGLTSPAASFRLVSDRTPPTVTVRCNGRSCGPGTYAKAVTITAFATDGSGSGIDTIRYTTDGTNPTATHGVEYTRSFTVDRATRLKVRAFDKAGNASPVVALTIRSTAYRLVFAAPSRLTTTSTARYLTLKVTSTRHAIVTVTMRGPGLKTPHRWQFIIDAGATIVRFRLPPRLAPRGRYTLVWTVRSGAQKTTRTTLVAFAPPKPKHP
jgi:Chitobiase/beta-hexosaminidase C-terminal domain